MKTLNSTSGGNLLLAVAALVGTHFFSVLHAAETGLETAMRQHMTSLMQLVSTNRALALQQTLAGLEQTPTKQLWGVDLAMIFGHDRRVAQPLRGAERAKRFSECREYLQRGLALAETALKAHPGDQSLTFQLAEIRSALALASLEAGETATVKNLARQQLAANTDPKDWNYGNVIHNANAQLGRAALRDGDKTAAAEFLLKAGATPGSPQLNSFGPDFTLARELLEAGDSKTVLAYLDLVQKFWVDATRKQGGALSERLASDHAARLDHWRAEIRAGRKPKNF
ncbi:hypothetical protein LBMAG56_39190 [Verrucomicrobiota bacterium]|nr:hypothetical protein LBMAG56_39190 [Verrucomicrobiota bacterium]